MKNLKFVLLFILSFGIIVTLHFLSLNTNTVENDNFLVLSSAQSPEIESDADDAKDIPKEERITQKTQDDTSPQLQNIQAEDESTEEKISNKCTISIRCDAIAGKDGFEKYGFLPKDGIITDNYEVEIEEGETVFDILLKTASQKGISIDYTENIFYNSVYIKAIGGLKEFDFGKTSGWMYKVNGVLPTKGCSQYKILNGDIIEFYYSCKP